jgi:hypothetical protein
LGFELIHLSCTPYTGKVAVRLCSDGFTKRDPSGASVLAAGVGGAEALDKAGYPPIFIFNYGCHNRRSPMRKAASAAMENVILSGLAPAWRAAG